MGRNNTTRSISMIVILVLILLSDAGTQADSRDASPPSTARRPAGAPPPPEPTSSTFANCPQFMVEPLIDYCRSPPGLPACAAGCLIYHYRGGVCKVMPNGRPGDCLCTNCLLSGDAYATPAVVVPQRPSAPRQRN